jgi:hypothetical protein
LRNYKAAFACSLSIFYSTAALSQIPQTGKKFVEQCEDFESNIVAMQCASLVYGIWDGYKATSGYLTFINKAKIGVKNELYCEDRKVAVGEMIELAVDYLKANPDMAEEPIGPAVLAAWISEWPC